MFTITALLSSGRRKQEMLFLIKIDALCLPLVGADSILLDSENTGPILASTTLSYLTGLMISDWRGMRAIDVVWSNANFFCQEEH